MKRIAFAAIAVVAGCQRVDPLFCGMHPDAVECGGTNGAVSIGGSVMGLSPSKGLVLQNNGGDDKAIASDGNFVFATGIVPNSPYNVTVSVQPTEPSKQCAVAGGTGTAMMDVNNVQVSCMVATYAIGGSVVGLDSGTQVILANGSDHTTVTSNTTFKFPTQVPSGSTYMVTVDTQPSSGGPCQPFGGSGTVGNSDVTSIVVNCSNNAFAIGGNVAGLNGIVILQNNMPSNTVMISSNGTYAFPTPVPSGQGYSVSVNTQPSYPPAAQDCMVQNPSGTANGNIQNINVTCSTLAFTVGGNVTGLVGTVMLQNNGTDTITIANSGGFTFQTPIASGTGYDVTVSSQPATQTCTVSRGTGAVGNGNVTNVAVSCKNNDPGIRCGSGYCDVGSQVCCSVGSGPFCGNAGCSGAAACDDAADCGMGQVCCGQTNGGQNKFDGAYCTSGSCGWILCDPNAQNPCPGGLSCRQWGSFPAYHVCQ